MWNQLHKQPALLHYEKQRLKDQRAVEQLTRTEQSEMHAGRSAIKTVADLRAKGGAMTKADKAVVKCTLISCSTGTEVEDKVVGRQAETFSYKGKKSCRRCYRSELDAALEHGTGRILPTARDCAELLVEEMSLTTKGKRVAAGGKQHENKDYTINRSFYRVWDTKNPLPRAGLKEAGAIEGTRTHYCYAAISTPGIMSTTQSLTPHCPSAFAPHSS